MITAGMFSSNTNEWATPIDLFRDLDAEFHFNLDPCSTDDNAKCEKHYTIDNDGLTQNWGGAKSVLQSSIRTRVAEVGAEMLRRIAKARHACRHAHTGKDGHFLFPRLHLPQGKRNPIPARSSAFQRVQTRRTVPINDRGLLVMEAKNDAER